MNLFEDPFLNFLVHHAPGDLLVAAFLVVFLTRMPRQRGLTLAITGCVVKLLVSMAAILRMWLALQDDFLLPNVELLFSAWIAIPLAVVECCSWILCVVALHLLLRDSSQHVADTQHIDALRPFGPAS